MSVSLSGCEIQCYWAAYAAKNGKKTCTLMHTRGKHMLAHISLYVQVLLACLHVCVHESLRIFSRTLLLSDDLYFNIYLYKNNNLFYSLICLFQILNLRSLKIWIFPVSHPLSPPWRKLMGVCKNRWRLPWMVNYHSQDDQLP